MSHRSSFLLYLLFHAATSFICAYAQAPPTPEEALARWGIPNTKQGIRQGLSNKDARVRSTIAGLMALRGDRGGIPLLRVALRREQDPRTKEVISKAIDQLLDDERDKARRAICSNPNASALHRINAAQRLLDKREFFCTNDVVNLLLQDSDRQLRSKVWMYLRRITLADPTTATHIRAAMKLMLISQDPEDRVYASEVMVVFATYQDLSSLEHAISVEADVQIKSDMQRNLERIKSALPNSLNK